LLLLRQAEARNVARRNRGLVEDIGKRFGQPAVLADLPVPRSHIRACKIPIQG
jgi:hypothetical protein